MEGGANRVTAKACKKCGNARGGSPPPSLPSTACGSYFDNAIKALHFTGENARITRGQGKARPPIISRGSDKDNIATRLRDRVRVLNPGRKRQACNMEFFPSFESQNGRGAACASVHFAPAFVCFRRGFRAFGDGIQKRKSLYILTMKRGKNNEKLRN